MRHPGLTIALLSFLCTAPAVASVNGDNLCDYYDLYSEFIVTFPMDTALGKSGPSAVSGITFIFPDQSTLDIIPGTELYDPLDDDPDSDSSRPDDINFIRDHAQDSCRIEKNENDKWTKISCKDNEYTIIAADNQKHRTYIEIYYDFKSKKYAPLYRNIMDSFVLVPEDPKNESAFYRAAMQANYEYYFTQDAAFRELVDSYKIPVIVCGSYRIRDKILHGK